MKPRYYPKQGPTITQQKMALQSIITLRRNIDMPESELESLARCYRVKVSYVKDLIAKEKESREQRGLG